MYVVCPVPSCPLPDLALGSAKRMRAAVLEMVKCEIVCANCHRIRTFKRGQGIYGKLSN